MVTWVVLGVLVLWILIVGAFMWSLGRYEYEDFIGDDATEDFPTCERCGAELEVEDCWKCGGDGGEFPYENFPLAYAPDEWKACDECGGRGTLDYCPEARRHAS